LWPRLLPQLAQPEIPEATGGYSSNVLDWTLYQVDIALPEVELTVELGLAELDGITYLLLLQSAPDEFEVLREQVLLPALEATAPLAPEPTPHPSTFDYAIEEVSFPGAAADVQLAGTLTLPFGPGPHPVVVTMSGSGPSDRDESLAPITSLKPFAVLADALTSAGVGVLRFDDRGVGESSGDHAGATVQDFAADAGAAIDYLVTRADVDPGRIGLFGHSEGGLHAAILGASDPRVAFIGTMAPGAVDGISLIVAQNEALLRAAGAPEEQIEAAVAFTQEVMPIALAGDAAAVEALTLDYYGGVWDGLGPEERVAAGERDAFARARAATEIEVYTSDWFRSFLGYDPAADWEKVTVPVLAVFGGKDAQVVAEQNEPALVAALKAAGNPDFATITFPEANHLFQAADTGAFAEYATLEPEFVDGLVDTIVEWMTVRAGVAE
jgi:pimeloyl-ACP methyl ester carboxylesterase